MYHKTSIERLSPAQVSKLLNGHRVRVKHGHGHEVHLSQEQHKKLHSAHRRGAGITMQLDPYQIQMHQHLRHAHHAHLGRGDGLFDSAKKYAMPVARAVAPALIDVGSSALKSYVEGHGNPRLHSGTPTPIIYAGHGEGLVRRRAVRRGRGEGLIRRRAPTHRGRGKKYHKGGALYPAGYGEGSIGSKIGETLGDIFLPF